ncbi:MAG: triple tyrosine motif-containing protein [Saprospiraceae bacterium]|jgi:ligand-binding sensor domain-containing protein/DNA-binding CsgD family transcriptional regulator/uncharacterized protein YoxC|nr:triple tyrosine motif-containing protein [Saprospiraceae bacterium]
MRYHLITILLISFGTFSLNAQFRLIGSPSVTNFPRSEYHAGTQNWLIKQDDRGLLYFANNKGLLEFDGTNWETYPLPKKTIVRSFSFAPDKKLYVGGQNEMGYLGTEGNGKKEYVSLVDLIPKEWKNFDDIWKIFIQSDEIIFCAEKVLLKYANNEITVIQPPTRFENFFKLNNKIYVQDKEEGLFYLENDQLFSVSSNSILSKKRIVALLPHLENKALIITALNGLYLMDDSQITPWQTASSKFLIDYHPYCATQLTDGRYAIGTSENGLILINQEGQLISHINKNKGLQNNTILSIFQDTQKNLWLGLDNGIDYVEINTPFSIIRSEEGIEGTGYAVTVHNDKLYLGTNQGVFYSEWNDENNPLTFNKFKSVQGTNGQVWNFNKLGENVIISQHKGASYLNESSAQPFSYIQGSWKFLPLSLHPEYVIEGTYTGLNLYKKGNTNPQDYSNLQFIRKLEGFNESSRIMDQDKDGNIWVSHAHKGLYKIKLSNELESIEKITFYTTKQGLPTDLFINVVKFKNQLFFTTPQGIYKYEQESDRFIKEEQFEKIFGSNPNVHRLIEDKTGNIWFSVNNDFGVLKVEENGVFNKLELVYFNQIQEELVDGFEQVYAYDDHNIFIGSEKGFIHYNPSLQNDKTFPFQILIRKVTSITEKDSTIFWGNLGDQSTEVKRTFSDKMNDFRFSFSAPYYEKINYVRYRFLLKGFDDTWSDWSDKTEKEYTNLSAGDYEFSVQAINAYGKESDQAVFTFTILPPWYLTLYAKLGYLLLTITVLQSLIRFIRKNEQKKREELELEQSRELEQKEAEHKKEVEKSENEIILLRNQKLKDDINHKTSQLASATMHLVQKGEILLQLKSDLNQLLKSASQENKKKIQQISRVIEADIRLDNNWEQFELYFDQVHENFFKRLRKRFPELTPKDQKLCAYLRMNLSTKEIAPLLNISVRGVEISRYRLRKKLSLDSEMNLVGFIMDI